MNLEIVNYSFITIASNMTPKKAPKKIPFIKLVTNVGKRNPFRHNLFIGIL